MTPYQPRAVRFRELWEPGGGWRIKLYGIAHGRPEPRPALVAGARQAAARLLRAIPGDVPHYRVGYLVVHDGLTNGFVFLDYWAHENEIYHHFFFAPADDPTRLEDITATGRAACVWDLALQSFERNAWVEHVLKRADAPDFDAYLAATLNADV